ncbi:hypothetical protein LX36DRAFT_17367 [Colletotrichum falcatum]|nr:hypothetical protein LX36DRAFT_17367 [Colletotrichum falcatum]
MTSCRIPLQCRNRPAHEVRRQPQPSGRRSADRLCRHWGFWNRRGRQKGEPRTASRRPCVRHRLGRDSTNTAPGLMTLISQSGRSLQACSSVALTNCPRQQGIKPQAVFTLSDLPKGRGGGGGRQLGSLGMSRIEAGERV